MRTVVTVGGDVPHHREERKPAPIRQGTRERERCRHMRTGMSTGKGMSTGMGTGRAWAQASAGRRRERVMTHDGKGGGEEGA